MERRGLDAGHLAMAFGETPENLLELIVQSVPVGVILVDAGGHIVLANPAIAELFLWELNDLRGRAVEDLIPEQLRATHEAHRAHFGEHPAVRPMGRGRLLEGRRADGSTFIVEVSLSPLVLDEEFYALACVRDITARVNAEDVRRREEAWQAVLDDRIRIARDLHDTVIQELFASGLTISNVSALADEELRQALEEVVRRLDEIIHHVRQAVFRLHTLHGPQDDLGRIVKEAARVLGFEPEMKVNGDPNSLSASLRADVGVVVRESLANVARHARADWACVSIEIGEEEVVVTVADSGVGLPAERLGAGTGLRSIEERALARGGSARFDARSDGGTEVGWRVPTASGGPAQSP